MISVNVIYPDHPSALFDLSYYLDQHLPLVRRLLAPYGLRSIGWSIPTGKGSPIRLIAKLCFNTMPEAESALSKEGPKTQADIANFTNILPMVMIGEESSMDVRPV